jgi:hypothetical protein
VTAAGSSTTEPATTETQRRKRSAMAWRRPPRRT